MAEHLKLRGDFYEVGKQLGSRKSGEIQQLVAEFTSSAFFKTISDYIGTADGGAIYKTFVETCNAVCASYVNELKGVAEGAGVLFDNLFKLNLDPEFAAILEEVPGSSHGVKYGHVYDGCTNISLETQDEKVLFAHTEDIGPEMVAMAIMLSVEIVQDGKLVESWTDHVVPGVLPGSKFGFNSYGVMFGNNNIYQKGVNLKGVPRKFMCRSLLNVSSADDALVRFKAPPGIATAYSFQFLQHKSGTGVCTNTVIEAAGDSRTTGSRVTFFHPRGLYHHCNMFQHLSYPCHPEASSIHRAAVLAQYANCYQATVPTDKESTSMLMKAISDRADTKFPVHRSGEAPDYLATAATGMYDVSAGKLDVYTGVPSKTSPKHTFHVPH